MRSGATRTGRAAGLALVGLLGTVACSTDRTTSATMVSIVAALRTVLPMALGPERFADPANRPAIETALATLSAGGTTLVTHGYDTEAGFDHLGRYFVARTGEIERRFHAGETEEARFLLGMLAETCIDCHARLPSARDSAPGSVLFQPVAMHDLELPERARLEVATRQFDRALDTYETMLRSTDYPATRLDLGGHLTDYLIVAVRVRDDPARARRGLALLAARPDVSRHLAGHLGAWMAALERLEQRPPSADLVVDARALLDEATQRSRFPADRQVLVEAIAASRRLNRFVDAHPAASEQTAEAYYLLGRAEVLIRRSFGASLGEFYLETAIRMAPDAPFARAAYDMLKQQTIALHQGSAGTFVPPDVRARLDELRRMVGGTTPEPAAP